MAQTSEYFLALISQFYQKATSNHSQKVKLQKKYHQFLLNSQKIHPNQKQIKSQPKTSQNNLIAKLNNLTNAQNYFIDKIQIKTDNPLISSKDSSSSEKVPLTSEIIQNQKVNVLFQSQSFPHCLVFAYFYALVDSNDTKTLTDLKKVYFNSFTDTLQKGQIQRLSYYWGKIILLSQNKQEKWQTAFSKCFKTFSQQFKNQIFLMTTNFDPLNLTYGMVNKNMIKSISNSLRVGLNYFCLQGNTTIFQVRQNQQIKMKINLVFIKQNLKFKVIKQTLNNSSEEETLNKLTLNLGLSISKLLQKYQNNSLFSSFQNISTNQPELQTVSIKNNYKLKSQNNIYKIKDGTFI